MGQLIVIDKETARELGRRPMHDEERYAMYLVCSKGGLLTFNGCYYRLHTVAWRMPQRECVVRVTFDSYATSVDCE